MLNKIVVKNFMCHDHFEIVLNPRVNFITGQNGSGKSAIVAALMVGFGQRATVTNRALSVKDFIKKGRHSAVTEITLCNDPDNGFKYEEYGSEITIVRRITYTCSNYLLRDSQGKNHPCNAKLLNSLMLHFSIQPNNPLCILSQDVARTFLQKFDPKSLYNLYSQATLSKTINESFADSKDTHRKAQLHLAQKREQLEKLKAEVEEAEKKKKIVERYVFLKERIQEVKNEVIWAKISYMEETIEKKHKVQADLDAERDKMLDKIKNSSEEALILKLRELHVDLDQTSDKLANVKAQNAKEKDALVHIEEVRSNHKQELKELEQLIQRKDRDIKELEEASNKVLNVNVPEIQKQKQELQAIVAKIHELEAVRKTSEVHLSQLRDTYENNAPEIERITREIEKVKNKISESKAQIDLLKQGKSLALYGRWMPTFVEEINRAAKMGRFSKKPKGPLGTYLQVVDPHWAPVIENQLRRHLFQFCLNDKADLKVFNEIVERICPRIGPDASISQFMPNVYNYSEYEVKHHRYSSLISQIQCSDPDILNCLIDEMQIERILLVNDVNSALKICEQESNAPKNLKYCLTPAADTVYPSPNYKFYSGRMKRNMTNLLQVNQSQNVRILVETINSKEEEKRSLESERERNIDSTKSVKTDIAETQSTLEGLRKKLKDLNGKKIELEMKIDSEPISVDLYQKDIEMSVSEKETSSKKREQLLQKMTESESQIQKLKQNLHALGKQESVFSADKNNTLKLIDATEKDLRDKKRLGDRLRAHYHSLIEKEKTLRESLEKLKNNVQEMCEKADKSATPMENIRKLPEVEEELKAIKCEHMGLREFCKENTIEVAEQAFTEKKQWLRECSRIMKRLEEIAKATSEKLEKDLKTIEVSEQKQLKKAKVLFSEVLKKRDLQGTFSLDNNKQILKMHVVRGKEKGTGKKGEISSLSGGEKSFATIAFIIAVWESMTVPFFVMDEFDVFTDVITRNTILKMLLEYASQSSAQFIFLTPHDLSRVETSRQDVSVHRISSPRA
ncbi:structural maintenance of chromosomes protein 6 [Nilaparvata lugens]|uniref:structural maintenance of chromosomes protein 6 n=1 Tax=Nilaparvata lugens TaxID=108931 RepID=UPI00193D794E|nr:structural maintenance of chromosomes protein 6 [Nilaparvata lugens]XP_022184190.2 structural maintenance of chromosomes protein 6 [Nilaparvata lugens]XP_039277139.1 structural maintenance of chromosomes protein 6 [Nilaparvata lugens]XP_039277140.1 structural maintenance of chromosomes protein 6 [Nilaparvata lugens]